MTADPTRSADHTNATDPTNNTGQTANTDHADDATSAQHTEDGAAEESIGKAPIYVSLGLSLSLVAVVLVGARIIGGGAPTVTLSDLPAEHADSAECQQLIASLPDDVAGLPRAEIAEPAPAGVAAWSSGSSGASDNYRDQVSLRCGVDMPFQYSEYSAPQAIGDGGDSGRDDRSGDGSTDVATEWIEVRDQTPGSSLSTWYTTNRFPTVAVTVDRPEETDSADGAATEQARQAIEELTGATEALALHEHTPHPAPLSELTSAGPDAVDMCHDLLEAARDGFTPAEGYELYTATRSNADDNNADNTGRATEADTVAWTHPGYEPIVLRCGIADPEVPRGERLQQINEVPWYEDTVLADGTTASTWYPLGREVAVAVSTPQASAQEALSRITELVKQHTPATPEAG